MKKDFIEGIIASARVVNIMGAPGAGATTIGAAMQNEWGYNHLDVDDYFWRPTNPPFIAKRPIEERQKMLLADINSSSKCVISGSLCGWGDIFIPKLDLIIFLKTPTEVRVDRLRKREYEKLGSRILHGGDLKLAHENFINTAKAYDTATSGKCLSEHLAWLRRVKCSVIDIDGSLPVPEILKILGSSYGEFI